MPPEPRAEIRVEALTDVLPAASLEWLVELRPAETFAHDVLKPGLEEIFASHRLHRYAEATGLDLRSLTEIAFASYRGRDGSSTRVFVARHRADALSLERKFRERLTSDVQRSSIGYGLVGVWGVIGRAFHGFAALGPEVVAYQYGGDRPRGPARVALLHADRRLATPPLSRSEEFASLVSRLGGAAVRATFLGPFEGAAARGARGLLAAAISAGVAIRLTEQRTLALRVVLLGDFDAAAVRFLELAWSDLAASDLGHLLGLGAPAAPVAVGAIEGGLELATEIDASALLDGIAAATSADVTAIMR